MENFNPDEFMKDLEAGTVTPEQLFSLTPEQIIQLEDRSMLSVTELRYGINEVCADWDVDTRERFINDVSAAIFAHREVNRHEW